MSGASDASNKGSQSSGSDEYPRYLEGKYGDYLETSPRSYTLIRARSSESMKSTVICKGKGSPKGDKGKGKEKGVADGKGKDPSKGKGKMDGKQPAEAVRSVREEEGGKGKDKSKGKEKGQDKGKGKEQGKGIDQGKGKDQPKGKDQGKGKDPGKGQRGRTAESLARKEKESTKDSSLMTPAACQEKDRAKQSRPSRR